MTLKVGRSTIHILKPLFCARETPYKMEDLSLSPGQGARSVSYPTVCFPHGPLSIDSLSPNGLFLPVWTPLQLFVPLTPCFANVLFTLDFPLLHYWPYHVDRARSCRLSVPALGPVPGTCSLLRSSASAFLCCCGWN